MTWPCLKQRFPSAGWNISHNLLRLLKQTGRRFPTLSWDISYNSPKSWKQKARWKPFQLMFCYYVPACPLISFSSPICSCLAYWPTSSHWPVQSNHASNSLSLAWSSLTWSIHSGIDMSSLTTLQLPDLEALSTFNLPTNGFTKIYWTSLPEADIAFRKSFSVFIVFKKRKTMHAILMKYNWRLVEVKYKPLLLSRHCLVCSHLSLSTN